MTLQHKSCWESEKLGFSPDFQWKDRNKGVGNRNIFANWLGQPQVLIKKKKRIYLKKREILGITEICSASFCSIYVIFN